MTPQEDSMPILARAGIVALLIGGCAVTPPGPPVAITDAKAIAGEWQGTVRTARGELLPVTLWVKDDGAYDSVVRTTGQRFPGTFTVADGRAQVVATRGVRGTWVLHERQGRPVLVTDNDERTRGELTRVP
jgi:hypothetical protein